MIKVPFSSSSFFLPIRLLPSTFTRPSLLPLLPSLPSHPILLFVVLLQACPRAFPLCDNSLHPQPFHAGIPSFPLLSFLFTPFSSSSSSFSKLTHEPSLSMATPSTTTNSSPASPPSISSPSSSPTSPPHPPPPSSTMSLPLYGSSLHLHPILFSDPSFPLHPFSFSSSSSSKPAHEPSFSMAAPSTSTQSSPATLPSPPLPPHSLPLIILLQARSLVLYLHSSSLQLHPFLVGDHSFPLLPFLTPAFLHPPPLSPRLYGSSLYLHPILASDPFFSLSFLLTYFSSSSSSSSKLVHEPFPTMVAPTTSTHSSPATILAPSSFSSPTFSCHPHPPS